jgi:hypothetical protein
VYIPDMQIMSVIRYRIASMHETKHAI